MLAGFDLPIAAGEREGNITANTGLLKCKTIKNIFRPLTGMDRRQFKSEDLGSRLKELLKEADMTQKELADCLGFDESYTSRVINEKSNLTLPTLDEVCKLLRTTPQYLMYGEMPVHYKG